MLPAACGRKHSTGFDGFAYVANEEGHAIAAVDLTAFAVVRHVPLKASPTEVIAHGRAQSVYALTPETGSIHEIDTGKLTVARKFQAGASAVSMRLPYEDPSRLYALYRDPRKLVCFSTLTGAEAWQQPLPAEAVDFDVSGDGHSIAISFGASGTLGLIDSGSRKLDLIETGGSLGLTRFRSDGRAMITADVDARMLLFHDVAQRRLIVRLPLAVRPDQMCTGGKGGQLFVTGEGQDAVVVVYPYQTEVAETLLAGRKPGAMATSSGKIGYLFIANPTSGDVTVMNLATRKVVAIASVGAEPAYISVTPDNQYALVLNRKSGDMGVLWIQEDKLTRREKSIGLFTMIPVGSRPVSAAIRQV